METPPIHERLQEVFRRLSASPPSTSIAEAHRRLCEIITQVEDELTPYPNDPSQWMLLPRIFPPDDSYKTVVLDGTLVRYGHKAHITYLTSNGAIEIRRRTRSGAAIEVVFVKPGADGLTVVEFCPTLRDRSL